MKILLKALLFFGLILAPVRDSHAIVPIVYVAGAGTVAVGSYLLNKHFGDTEAEPADQTTFRIIVEASKAGDYLSTELTPKVAYQFANWFGLLWLIYAAWMTLRFMAAGSIDPFKLGTIFIWPLIVLLFVSQSDQLIPLFKNGIILKNVTELTNSILEVGIGVTAISSSSGSPLELATRNVDLINMNVDTLIHQYVNSNDKVYTLDILLHAEAMAVKVIYFLIKLAFTIVFSMSLVAIQILFALFIPILMFGSIPWFRSLLNNWFKAVFTTALTPIFAAIALALTTILLEGVAIRTEEILGGSDPVPQHIMGYLAMMGLLSLFFHISASTFAAMITLHNVTNFGQTFTTAVTMGAGWAKMGAAGAARAITPAAEGAAKGAGGFLKNQAGKMVKDLTGKV